MKKAIVAWFLAILMVLTQISTVMADTTGSWIETADISDAIVSGGVAECIDVEEPEIIDDYSLTDPENINVVSNVVEADIEGGQFYPGYFLSGSAAPVQTIYWCVSDSVLTISDQYVDAPNGYRGSFSNSIHFETVEDVPWSGFTFNKVEIIKVENAVTPVYMDHWFDRIEILRATPSVYNQFTEFEAEGLDTSYVVSMKGLFSSCSDLETVDLSRFNTSNVTDMSDMFFACTGLKELDLSGFDTSNVTDMTCMFMDCRNIESIDLSSFDTSNVTDMTGMFAFCSVLQELNLSSFDTLSVTKMGGMFYSCTELKELDLSSFDTSNVRYMSGLIQIDDEEDFYNFGVFTACENLERIMVSEKFDTGKVEEDDEHKLIDMFSECVKLKGSEGTVYDATHTDLSYAHIDGGQSNPGYFTAKESGQEESDKYTVTFDSNGHGTAPAQQQIAAGGRIEKPDDPISEGYTFEGWYKEVSCENRWNFDTDVVNEDTTLFAKWTNSTEIASGISGTCKWSVINYSNDRRALIIEPLNGVEGTLDTWDNTPPWYEWVNINEIIVRNKVMAKTCRHMFHGELVTESIDISGLDTSNVTDMSYMFEGGFSGITHIDVSGLNTSSVTNMAFMFDGCSSLTDLDLGNFDTGNVEGMSYMFNNCKSLQSINLSSFKTAKAVTMQSMFEHCENLKEIDVSSFDTSSVEVFNGMFADCSNLNTIYASDKFTTINNKTDYPKIFANSLNICGGKGTKWEDLDINHTMGYGADSEFARIDEGPVKPGLFTDINAIEDSGLKIIKFISPYISYQIYIDSGIKCYEFNYDNTLFDRCETPIEVEVSDGASWDLYSDKECLDKLDKNKHVSLTGETNVFYIKVFNDTESRIYKVLITRDFRLGIKPTRVHYHPSFSLSSDKGIEFDIQWGFDLFKNPLDHNCDRRTMIAALMLANGAYNQIEQVYKELGFNHICSNRRDPVVDMEQSSFVEEMTQYSLGADMAQYSFAGREVDFDGNKKLIIALTFRGTITGWDWAWNAIAATAPDVGFETGAASAVADMLDYFEHNLNQYDKEDMIFFVTGHSLGGAEANEAAMLLAKEYNPENIFAYTFNSPTTTDKSDYSVPKLFNLYNTEDIVPKAGEHYGIIQNITNGQWLGKRYGHDMPFTRGAFMEDEFRLITGGRGFNDVAPLYQSDYSTSFFESMGIALSNIFNSVAYNIDKIMLEHQPDTLLAYLLSSESVTVKPSQPGAWRRISVKCPVDIEVIDSNGVTVAKIVDNQIKELRDSSLTLFVCGDEKYILSSNNQGYFLKLMGTDSGEMRFAVDEIDFSTGEATTRKQFDHVALYEGKEMQGTINEVAEKSVLQLMENGKPIKNIETNGTETPISTTYTVLFNSNGHGTAPASQQISAGGKVSKPADLTASGYTFGGWYKESSCINQWNFGTDIVSSNMTLYAKWISKGNSSSGTYSSGGGGGSASKAKTVTGATYSPNWFVDASGVWRIRNSKGEIVKNAWLCDDVITANGQNVWYLLQADGSMLAAGLVQDNTGNFYSLETTHNGYFGMMRYKDGYYNCNGQNIYLQFSQKHDGTFGSIINPEGLAKLKAVYGVTPSGIGNESIVNTATF